ncbi:MAG: class I SAM-dependent methyltransferase [Dehalococcoidia bacterium]
MSSGVRRLRTIFYLDRIARKANGFQHVWCLHIGITSGVFDALTTPLTVDELADRTSLLRPHLLRFLNTCELLGILNNRRGRYGLPGWVKRYLTSDEDFTLRGMVLDYTVHLGPGLSHIPEAMRSGTLLSHPPENAAVIAEASRIMEPGAFRILRKLPVRRDGYRVLDVGCGSGSYLQYLAGLNPGLSGVGLELREDVAAATRNRIHDRDLDGRIEIISGDFWETPIQGPFDLAMLNSNLYYFPVERRPALVSKLAQLLAPGGHLAIQTPVPDERDASVALFDLALSAFDYYHGLPTGTEIGELFRAAGLGDVKVRPLYAFFAWKYFIAKKGG